MGMLQRLEKWSTTHHPRWLVFLRISLGIALVLKGITFISDSTGVGSLLSDTPLGISADSWIIVAIAWIHLFAGFMITIGLYTRIAALLQIPILLGAVIFVNAPRGILAPGSEFGLSLVILFLLIFFFIEGSGPVSLDNYFKKYQA